VSPRAVAVIGLGCIGGSLARALQARNVSVRAWSAPGADLALAMECGMDVCPDAASAVRDADVVMLAIPIDALGSVAPGVCAALASGAVAMHAGGLQRREALGLDEATHARLLGTHPLAGSHESGFRAARPELFAGCTVSVDARADASARAAAEWVWRAAGAARIDYRAADEHDRLMAWVSHLPQLAATALAATLSAAGIDPRDTGPGARDTTRLAGSPLAAWPSLLGGAPADLDRALCGLERTIAELRAALARGDRARLEELWNTARAWRRQQEHSS
jgi:prephenate dehydrogenase